MKSSFSCNAASRVFSEYFQNVAVNRVFSDSVLYKYTSDEFRLVNLQAEGYCVEQLQTATSVFCFLGKPKHVLK